VLERVPAYVTPDGQVFQKSTDGGLTYGPQYRAPATDGGRLGQSRAIR
jgi:hypothetical protein